MRLRITLLMVAWVPVLGVRGDDVEPKSDLGSLQGKWVAVGREFMGKKATKKEIEQLPHEIVIKGRTLTQWVEERGKKQAVGGAKFSLAPKAQPKALDLDYTSGPLLGKAQAIYELSGDTLKICYAMEGEGRPTEFAGKLDGKALLATYERVKKKK